MIFVCLRLVLCHVRFTDVVCTLLEFHLLLSLFFNLFSIQHFGSSSNNNLLTLLRVGEHKTTMTYFSRKGERNRVIEPKVDLEQPLVKANSVVEILDFSTSLTVSLQRCQNFRHQQRIQMRTIHVHTPPLQLNQEAFPVQGRPGLHPQKIHSALMIP